MIRDSTLSRGQTPPSAACIKAIFIGSSSSHLTSDITLRLVVPNGDGLRLFCAHDVDEFLPPADAATEKVPLEQDILIDKNFFFNGLSISWGNLVSQRKFDDKTRGDVPRISGRIQ